MTQLHGGGRFPGHWANYACVSMTQLHGGGRISDHEEDDDHDDDDDDGMF